MKQIITTPLLLAMFAVSMVSACTQLSKEDRSLLTSVQTTAEQAKEAAEKANAAADKANAVAEKARNDALAAQQDAAKSAADAKAAQDKSNRIFRQSQSK